MKKPTPKRKQPKSRTRSRYHTFENNAQRKLMGRVASMRRLKSLGKLTSVVTKTDKVTTVKA